MDIQAKKITYQSGLFCLLAYLANPAFALEDMFYVENWQTVISASGAPMLTSTPSSPQTIQLQSDITKTYDPTSNSEVFGRFEVFLGGQYELSPSTMLQLGLVSTFGQAAHLSGEILEDTNPDFTNYNYDYKVNNTTVGIKAKMLFEMRDGFFPYISGRASFASNRAYDFSITPKIFEEVPAPLFSSNTSKTFSYALGLGIERAYNANWRFGIGYEFSDWGNSSLGLAPGQTLNSGIALDNLYTNSIQFSVNYLC